MSQLIYKKSCWTCKRAQADPSEKYICPKLEQHWEEYQKQQEQSWMN